MNIDRTIMSQYEHSPRLLAMIHAVNGGIDPDKFTKDFYNVVINLPTARGFGLDIWGRIVGTSRTVKFPNPDTEYFGFSEGYFPFNEAPFSSSGGEDSQWELEDVYFRELILLKALSNIIYATAINISRLLDSFFKGKAYCVFNGHMALKYVFDFVPQVFQNYLIYNSGLIPAPCGVKIEIETL